MPIKNLPMRDSFLSRLHCEMREHRNIFFLSADFGSPLLDKIRTDYPDRFINVGIAEQNLINVGTGLALEGFSVFMYAIAPFITMRCYEQIRVNISILHQIRKVNLTMVGVGAGCSYVVSGPTHQCFEDISIMRTLPNIEVISPADSMVSANMVEYCLNNSGGKYLRLDAQNLEVIYSEEKLSKVMIDGFLEILPGENICLLATGYMTHKALKIAESFYEKKKKIGVVDIINLTKFNSEELKHILCKYQHVVTMEEGFVGRGGLDALLYNFVNENNLSRKINIIPVGVPHRYGFQLGQREDVHDYYGIGVSQIINKIN
ncbi:MAG: transketolase, partial [Oligoflexia bacterium]|nr:transketolase [Oligoflexia bacterium]